MPSKYVEVDGYAVNYFHTGRTTLPDVTPDVSRGQLLLYLHGAGGNGHFAHKMLDLLSADHSPLSLDYPGHGRSSGTESLKSIPAYSDCIYAFWKKLGVRPAVLIGHSMGGAIAMDLALRHSEMVGGLVLTCTAAKFDIPDELANTWKQVMQGRMGQPFTKNSCSPATPMSVVQEGWMEQIKTDPRVRYFDLVACQQVDLTSKLGEIRKPTLVLAGQDDTTTPVAQSELLRDRIAGAKLTVVPQAGHWLPLEKPQEACDAIAAFLR
ncbi:MAG TPA: alpha/beta hydrolase [Candidatus Binatia bacterium]|nr:alpha/beta hydrolase [Candidatus Binatia bacterium]